MAMMITIESEDGAKAGEEGKSGMRVYNVEGGSCV